MHGTIAKSLLVTCLALALASLPASPSENLTPNSSDISGRLTEFLKTHRLPLVSAQVLVSPAGARSVMLYGFTATETGKSNAEKRTRLFLKDPTVPITNRIRVRPELASMRSPAPLQKRTEPAHPHDSRQFGDIEAYQNQRTEAARPYVNPQAPQYMNQQNTTASLVNTLIPLVVMGLAIGLGGSGKGLGVGISPGYSPYGGYGYGSPYGGVYGYPNPYGPGAYRVPGSGTP